ncbi:hypothetical protein [Streptomyces sp. LN549]|uniref:hypothetical protein n=1 Tax=Streptomyces sp. LN549 TaxID=3112979 RepID=UPI003714861D
MSRTAMPAFVRVLTGAAVAAVLSAAALSAAPLAGTAPAGDDGIGWDSSTTSPTASHALVLAGGQTPDVPGDGIGWD